MSDSYAGKFEDFDGVNTTNNAYYEEVDATRRQLIQSGLAAVTLMASNRPALAEKPMASKTKAQALSFTAVPISNSDEVVVPPEYSVQVVYRWGDPVGAKLASPPFKSDASNTWQEQALQAGMHHDGMEYFPLSQNGNRGILAINHEYTDDGLLHPDGMKNWSAAKVRKSQEAHGVSVIEVERRADGWKVLQNSKYARRVTANTMMEIAGPAAGHKLMQTSYDPSGTRVLGTLNNCAAGQTPWGTYLTCEENWHGYFSTSTKPTAQELRYGMRNKGWGYQWHEFDTRFDSTIEPNEAHRFGWVVEIDPKNPHQTPVKRTALGRLKHEGATCTLSRDGRAVVYMGDDEKFEYIYKFVSENTVSKNGFSANKNILDTGKLYVARFKTEGVGEWVELTQGMNGLTADKGFATQADVLIQCRAAADAVGATKMDRPEWIAVHPTTSEVFVTLTNNNLRGQAGRANDEQVDEANPRADNQMGHILRWQETDSDAAAVTFRWMHFVLAGDLAMTKPEHQGTVKGDIFSCPDGLRFAPNGLLWIQTDISTSVMNQGIYQVFGNNMMLVADPTTHAIKRFLTGPSGCELTGIAFAPDQRTVFVNIQHPGETASERSDPDKPLAISRWPDGAKAGRPRSATLAIRRKDGGVVGT